MFFENLLNVKNDLLNNILLCAIIVLIILNYYSDYLRQIYYLSKVPGPPGVPLIGNLFSFLGSTKGFFYKIYKSLLHILENVLVRSEFKKFV